MIYADPGTEKWIPWARKKLAAIRGTGGQRKYVPESGVLVWIKDLVNPWIRITGGSVSVLMRGHSLLPFAALTDGVSDVTLHTFKAGTAGSSEVVPGRFVVSRTNTVSTITKCTFSQGKTSLSVGQSAFLDGVTKLFATQPKLAERLLEGVFVVGPPIIALTTDEYSETPSFVGVRNGLSEVRLYRDGTGTLRGSGFVPRSTKVRQMAIQSSATIALYVSDTSAFVTFTPGDAQYLVQTGYSIVQGGFVFESAGFRVIAAYSVVSVLGGDGKYTHSFTKGANAVIGTLLPSLQTVSLILSSPVTAVIAVVSDDASPTGALMPAAVVASFTLSGFGTAASLNSPLFVADTYEPLDPLFPSSTYLAVTRGQGVLPVLTPTTTVTLPAAQQALFGITSCAKTVVDDTRKAWVQTMVTDAAHFVSVSVLGKRRKLLAGSHAAEDLSSATGNMWIAVISGSEVVGTGGGTPFTFATVNSVGVTSDGGTFTASDLVRTADMPNRLQTAAIGGGTYVGYVYSNGSMTLSASVEAVTTASQIAITPSVIRSLALASTFVVENGVKVSTYPVQGTAVDRGAQLEPAVSGSSLFRAAPGGYVSGPNPPGSLENVPYSVVQEATQERVDLWSPSNLTLIPRPISVLLVLGSSVYYCAYSMNTTGNVALNLAQIQIDIMVGRTTDSLVSTLMASIVATCASLTGGAQPTAGLAQRVIDILNPAVTTYLVDPLADPLVLLDLFAAEVIGWYTLLYNNGVPNGLITVISASTSTSLSTPHFVISV